MEPLILREFHERLGARFITEGGCEVVADYGDPAGEYTALRQTAGAMDLTFRGRLCLTGADRARFLHGQVTNNVKDLQAGQGCYAALVTAKAKLQSDLNIFCLANELLLDFEPGLTRTVAERLDRYIIADDAQVVEAAPHYGLLSVQGPKARVAVQILELGVEPPPGSMSVAAAIDATLGEIYVANHARLGTAGFDLFIPTPALGAVMERLAAAARAVGGGWCGWRASEMVRIEAGIPRFPVDMDETNLVSETGIETAAVSYSKGCYIGQEIISRVKTRGEVAKAWRGLRLADDLKALPVKGDRLFHDGKEVGYITSALASPALGGNIGLGYARKESNAVGTELTLRSDAGESRATIVALPFIAPIV